MPGVPAPVKGSGGGGCIWVSQAWIRRLLTPYCPLLGAGGAPAMRTRAAVASGRGHFPGGDWGVDLDSRAPDGDGGVGTGHLDKPANPPSHAVVAWINCTKHSA